jgi:hypothetical protein
LIESLADIEALTLSCRSEQSKEYVSEAVLCYRSGAYRATIVSTWIAVIFDLIDKIRELALSGDAAAKAMESQYVAYLKQIEQGNDQGIKSALEFERNILDTCKDRLQLFDQQQFVDLCRLREDRHRCAHPSFQKVGEPYRPSAEQARLHFRNAVLHVLAQPPVQGKTALAELATLVSSTYFPTETGKAVTQLKSSPLQKPAESLIRGFIDQLLFGFFEENGPFYYKRQVIAAINASLEMHRSIVEQRLSKQLSKVVREVPDKKFPGAAALVAFINSSWSFLDASSRDKVVQFIRTGKVSEVIKALQPLSKIDPLRLEVESRVAKLSFDDLAEAIDSHRLGSLGKNRALEFLSEVRSWSRANDVINKTVLPIFDSLEKSDVEKIIRMPTEAGADLPGATSYGTLLEQVRRTGMFNGDELNRLLTDNAAGHLVGT